MAKSEKVTAADLLAGGKKKEGGKKKGGKHKYRKTETEHHPDGSHTVRHLGHDPADDTSYAAADLDGVKAGLDEHLGGGPAEAAGPPEPGGQDAGAGGMPPAPTAA